MAKHNGPKILFFDIETAPILAYVWNIWDQNIPLNMIVKDWAVLAWAAKWQHEGPNKIKYQDSRRLKDPYQDAKLLKGIWRLLDEADIVVTQNGKSFDEKKLNARFIQHGMPPTSPFRHFDTKRMAKSRFAFTSNKLEYLGKVVNRDFRKLEHKSYPGNELWRACLIGDQKAWAEMEKYNKQDVLALEELYNRLAPWDRGSNITHGTDDETCVCGSKEFQRRGTLVNQSGRYRRFQCTKCSAWFRGRTNLLSVDKKRSLLTRI